jgi:glutamyl-tRNA reductase
VDVREKFAFKDVEIPLVLADLRARGLITEGVILSTCNRVELRHRRKYPAAVQARAVQA